MTATSAGAGGAATASRGAPRESPDTPRAADDDGEGRRGPTPRLAALGAVWRMLGPVRGRLLVCAVLSGAGAAAGMAPYLAIAEIARGALSGDGPASPTSWAWVVAGAGGAALRLVLVFASSRLGHYVDAATLHDLRRRIVAHLGSLPLGWFREEGSGQVEKTMTSDLEKMHELIAHSIGQVVGAAVGVVVGVVYLVLVDPVMAMVTLAVALVMALSYRLAMRSMTTHMARLLDATTRISTTAVEYADGIAVVKTYGAGGRLLDRFSGAVADHTAAMKAWVDETRYSSAVSRLLAGEMTLLGVLMIVGIPMVVTGVLPGGDLVPFLVVGVGLPTSIDPAVAGALGIRQGRMAAAHVEDVLSRPALPEPDRPRAPAGNSVEFDDVRFSYDGSTEALRGVSAFCPPGTLTAIVGPSGAGKSTLAALLPRFYDVEAGAVRLGGVDVRDISASDLLGSLALVFQDTMLLRDSVAENIRLARPGATLEEVRAAARDARIDHVITALPDGYDTVLGDDGGGLSGGEQQRVAIARAILSDAGVVVLDEATAALDPDNESAVQDALGRLVAGRTVIVVAHRLATIVAADQILVLDRGRLAEAGTHDDLLAADGLYARLWRAQAGASPQATTAGGQP